MEQFEEEDVSGDVKFSRGGKPAPQKAKPAIESESVVVHQAEVLTFVVLLYSAAGLGVAVSLLTKKNTEDEYRNAVRGITRCWAAMGESCECLLTCLSSPPCLLPTLILFCYSNLT